MPSALSAFAGQAPSAGTVDPSKISTTFGGFFRNKIINGDFFVAQRGTSFSTPGNGAYTLDRWIATYDGTIGAFTVSQQAFTPGQTDVPNEPAFFGRWLQSSAGSGSSFRRISQRIESVQILAGSVAAITIYAKADASRNVSVDLVQNFGSGGSAAVVTSVGTLALTASWQKFTIQATLPSIAGKTVGTSSFLELRLGLPINTAMTIDLSHIQVEEISQTAFEQRPISLETALCARFYQICPTYVQTTGTSLPFKATMRGIPTVAGGAAGFATSNLSADGGSCLQTGAADQTLTLDAEL